jgi:hypothetical protein
LKPDSGGLQLAYQAYADERIQVFQQLAAMRAASGGAHESFFGHGHYSVNLSPGRRDQATGSGPTGTRRALPRAPNLERAMSIINLVGVRRRPIRSTCFF